MGGISIYTKYIVIVHFLRCSCRSTLLNQAFGTSFPVGGPLGKEDTTGEDRGHRMATYFFYSAR